jgi:hypothetical protein
VNAKTPGRKEEMEMRIKKQLITRGVPGMRIRTRRGLLFASLRLCAFAFLSPPLSISSRPHRAASPWHRMLARAIAPTLVGAVLAGCGSMAPPQRSEVPPATADRAVAAVRALSPGVATLIHKVSVGAPMGDLVLTGRLILDPGRGLRALAVDEVGGPLFDVTVCRAGETVHQAPPRLPLRLLRHGPVEDLRRLFLVPESQPEVLPAGATAARVVWRRGSTSLTYAVDVDAGRVTTLREARGQRLVREVRFEYAEDPSASGPTSIDLVNHRLGYRVDILLLDQRDGPPPATDLDQLILCHSDG